MYNELLQILHWEWGRGPGGGRRKMNDSMELVVIWKRERDSTLNAMSLISECPVSVTWYLQGSPHSGMGATIYVRQ